MPHVREESEQGFSTKGEKLNVEMSCSSLQQDNSLTLTLHFFTEPELRSSIKIVTVILTGPTKGPQQADKGKESGPRSCRVIKQVRRNKG